MSIQSQFPSQREKEARAKSQQDLAKMRRSHVAEVLRALFTGNSYYIPVPAVVQIVMSQRRFEGLQYFSPQVIKLDLIMLGDRGLVELTDTPYGILPSSKYLWIGERRMEEAA